MNQNRDRERAVDSTHSFRQPGVLAWIRLARVFQKVDRASSEGMRHHDLSMAQFDVLAHVGANEGISQQQLANSLLVTKGNVCQLLDRMEKSGLIQRHPEGRTNRLYPTEYGRKLFAQVVPAHEERIAEMFTSLSREEQSQLLRLLRKVDQSLERD